MAKKRAKKDDAIFTRKDRDRLRQLQKKLLDRLPTIDAAEQCGADCQEIREAIEEQRQQLQALEQHFMADVK